MPTTLETTHPLVSSCRYSRRLWILVAEWVGCRHIHPSERAFSDSVLQWWTNITEAPDIHHHGTTSLLLLVLWEIWLERNARVFNRVESSVQTVFAKIKSETSSWPIFAKIKTDSARVICCKTCKFYSPEPGFVLFFYISEIGTLCLFVKKG
jgi:hypothetical protein